MRLQGGADRRRPALLASCRRAPEPRRYALRFAWALNWMNRLLSKIASHKLLTSVLVVCLLVVCLPVYYVANEFWLKHKYDDALNRIQIVDPEATVVSLMGQPHERSWCYPLKTDRDSAEQKQFHEQCVQQYSYAIFLQRYTGDFDKNNRISGKYVSVSP